MSASPSLADLAALLGRCVRGEGTEAFDQLAAVLAAVPPAALPRLDLSFRQLGFSSGLEDFPPVVVDRLGSARQGWAACALLSLHGSGFVRESAVRTLGQVGDPRAVPFLIRSIERLLEILGRSTRQE